MNTTFKFDDKVVLNRYPDMHGIVTRVNNDNTVTICWEDEDDHMSTNPIEDISLYATSNIEKVMDVLGIKKDVPIDVYTKDGDEVYSYNPYKFNGETFVDSDGDNSMNLLSEIISGEAYFKPHLLFPQDGDIYYLVTPNGAIMRRCWDGLSYDYATKLMGNVFESRAEAECHVTEMLAKYREVM